MKTKHLAFVLGNCAKHVLAACGETVTMGKTVPFERRELINCEACLIALYREKFPRLTDKPVKIPKRLNLKHV